MTIIKPTIGRVVLVQGGTSDQARPALICYVHSDRLINVGGFDQNGAPFAGTSITLVQDGDEYPELGIYAEWMPYQKAVASGEQAPTLHAIPAPPPIDNAFVADGCEQFSTAIEREIQANGLTAPRITPQDIEANIASEWYINAGDGVVPDDFQPPVPASHPLRLLTLCVLVMKNGFTVTGESACVSPENFDAELGRKIARQNAIGKVWPLMGYALKDRLSA